MRLETKGTKVAPTIDITDITCMSGPSPPLKKKKTTTTTKLSVRVTLKNLLTVRYLDY